MLVTVSLIAALLLPASFAVQDQHQEAINVLLRDLEAMYDSDTKSFLRYDGVAAQEFGGKYRPAWPDLAALSGVRLNDHRQLYLLYHEGFSDLESFVSFVNPNWLPLGAQGPFAYNVGDRIKDQHQLADGQQIADVLLEALHSEARHPQLQGALPLDKTIGHRRVSWHSPHLVYALSVIHRRFPDLRSKTDLKTILDFWVQDMAQHPDPVRWAENATAAHDRSPYSRLYTIAALHVGSQLFDEEKYAAARDAQFERMRQLLEESGVLRAIREKTGWSHPDGWAFTLYQRPMTEAVSAYGQACVLLGRERGLREAQDWIVAALDKREGDDSPLINYRGATFAQRCGMIAVLRGRAAMLTPPLILISPVGQSGVRYDYLGYGEDGKVVVKGELTLNFGAPSKPSPKLVVEISGTWQLDTNPGLDGIGPQNGKGRLTGIFSQSEGLRLNLNPSMFDNNVILVASYDADMDTIEGQWFYSTFAGRTAGGTFNAKRRTGVLNPKED